MTICNMSIEFGARMGFVAPDDTAIEYVAGRLFAPSGAKWDAAVHHWRELYSDSDATFDREIDVDCAKIAPQVSWGNSPQDVGAVDAPIPDPAAIGDAGRREAVERALAYMGLAPGKPLIGTPIDFAFIGSCTNSRFSDLDAAAKIVRGRKVAEGVTAIVVPGSMAVRRAAEAAGLDRVFIDAGFEWRNAGCSTCVASNGEIFGPGKRAISTTNRNFENRQGPRSRTHLASPAMVAAAAVSGHIADVRKML
jgi:3-isopropylmalate/(R)-2-methylmalate dehydratase large subunit